MPVSRKAPLWIVVGIAIATAVGSGLATQQQSSSQAQSQLPHHNTASLSHVESSSEQLTSKQLTSEQLTSEQPNSINSQSIQPGSQAAITRSIAHSAPFTPPSTSIASTAGFKPTEIPATLLAWTKQDIQQPGDTYPTQKLVLRDEVETGSDFAALRTQLRQVIRDRDAKGLRAIAHPNIQLTFGRTITLDDLKIDNPEAVVWQKLERVIGTGCAASPSALEVGLNGYWACPSAFLAPDKDPNIDGFENLVVTGTEVAIRELPNLNSPVLQRVSHEVLKSGGHATHNHDALSEAEQKQIEDWYALSSTNQGWQYVQLPDGRKGFISSQYAFSPIGYRAIFQKDEAGQWKMTAFIAGD